MKKTLVALAILAASGATFAQATITGKYGFGVKTSTGPGSNTASGLGISDSNISFNASEDMGGGMKAAAQLKIDSVNRGGIAGGDSFVSLSGGFGTVTLGQGEWDTDLPDSFGTFMGATLLGGKGSNSEPLADFAQYATSFGPVGVAIRHTENATGKGLGAGAAGSSAQRQNTITGTYAAGPLSAKVDYTAFDNKPDGVAGLYDNRSTIGGNYDFGVASIGLGYQNTKWTQGASAVDTFFGVVIPVGALTVGVDFINEKIDGISAANDKNYSGWGIQALYSLSKRTSVRFRTNSYEANLGDTEKTTSSALVLQHTF